MPELQHQEIPDLVMPRPAATHMFLENSLDHEPDALRATFVAKEKRLLTIADQNESIVGNVRSGFRGHFDSSSAVSFDANIRKQAIRPGLIVGTLPHSLRNIFKYRQNTLR